MHHLLMRKSMDDGVTPHLAWIGLGANLGDRGEALAQAVAAMDGLPHTCVQAVSSLYSSAPVDASGPDYLNAVACLQTTLEPLALLHHLQAIELAAGRERPYRNAPRTLDLDVLLFGDWVSNAPELIVPHPRLFERAFALLPLSELAPHQVPATALHEVAGQRIEKIASPAQWCPAIASASKV